MKKFALLLICFCFLLLLGCSLKDQTSQSAANQGVKDADDVQTPTSEELDPMDKKPEKETAQTFAMTVYQEPEKTFQISEKDTALLEELFDLDRMEQMPSTSENAIGCCFCRRGEIYMLSDTLDYVDVEIRNAEDSYCYYAKSLSEEEAEAVKTLIESYVNQ